MKLDIIGLVASGKTTLAREISMKYQIPFYEKTVNAILIDETSSGLYKQMIEIDE